MEAKESILLLEKSSTYTNWKKDNLSTYLVNCFKMTDPGKDSDWQIGYYDKDSKKITTFLVGDEIILNNQDDVLREKGIIQPLNLENIKITYDEAIESALNCQNEKYPGNAPLKKIVVLQNIDEGEIYNVTFVTQSFKTLNIKVSHVDGKIISDKMTSIFDFQ